MIAEVIEKQLVTFALFSYNQEAYIREAVDGAFGQTYSPLEILLLDDCSRDSTFEVLSQAVSAYRGPHRTRLSRSPINRGLSAQIDAAVKMAQGEWMVVAAGDDISLPDRVANHMAIADAHPNAFSSFLAPVPFGECADGRVPVVTNRIFRYPESLQAYGGGVIGATHAFKVASWWVFGDLGPGIISEDWVIPFRSSLLGSVVWSDRPGVRYRVHGNSVTAFYWGQPGRTLPSARQLHMEANALETFERDLRVAMVSGIVTDAEAKSGLQWLDGALTTTKLILRCVEADSWRSWLRSALKLLLFKQFIGNYRRRINLLWRSFESLRRRQHRLLTSQK